MATVFSTCLTDLPEELLNQIFNYLPYYDLLATTQVCHRFYDNSAFLDKTLIRLKFDNYVIRKEMKMPLASWRHYRHFSIQTTHPNIGVEAWLQKFGASIKTIWLNLHEKSKKLSIKEYLKLLAYAPDIREIKVTKGLQIKSTMSEKKDVPNLKTVKVFHFTQNELKYADQEIEFITLITEQMELEELKLKIGSMSYDVYEKLPNVLKSVKRLEHIGYPVPSHFFSICKSIEEVTMEAYHCGFFRNVADTEKDIYNVNVKKFSCLYINEETEAAFRVLSTWPTFRNLETLKLHCNLEEETVKNVAELSKLKNLKHLTLKFPTRQNSPIDYSKINLPKLESLRIQTNVQFTDVNAIVKQFPKLKAFEAAVIFDEEVVMICDNLLYLEELSLSDRLFSGGLREWSMESLGKLKHLKKLNLNKNVAMKGHFLKYLALPKLEYLGLCESVTGATTEDFISFFKHCPNLKEINLQENSNLEDEVIILIANNCKMLESLRIYHTGVTDVGLDSIIANCKYLKFLSILIDKKKTTRSQTYIFEHMPNLRVLELDGGRDCRFTELN